jgi:hypothetical protein
MAHSTIVKNFGDGSITIEDGTTPTALDHTDNFEQGDLTITGLKATQRETTAYESRGTLKSVRHTGRTYPTGSFSLMLADLSDGTDETLVDILLKQGAFSSAVSTLDANAEVYTVKITLTIEGTDHGDSADHTIVMDDVECTVDIAEGDPNTVTVNFTVYGSVTMT